MFQRNLLALWYTVTPMEICCLQWWYIKPTIYTKIEQNEGQMEPFLLGSLLVSYILETREPNNQVIVTGDNLASYFVLSVILAGEEHDTISTNATHSMQPLDVALFAPIKKEWRAILEVTLQVQF